MFASEQEIGLLRDSLLSVTNSKSGSLFDCDDVEKAVNVIHKYVKYIVMYKLYGIKEEKEAIKRQLLINEKLHASIFFVTLRSHGIISNSADTFYNSIVYSWPAINFKFYMELNFKCDWSEYFIKCAVQLPPEVLYKVLTSILHTPLSSDIEFYTWHLILQTLILKLLEVPFENGNNYPFNFDFTAAKVLLPSTQAQADNEVTEKYIKMDYVHSLNFDQDAKSCLKVMFNNLISNISAKLKESNQVDVIKILLHAVKTLLKTSISEDKGDFKNASQFIDFLIIYDLLKDYLLTDANKGFLKAALQNCHCTVVYHAYATSSWNISLNYLTFLLDYYSDELHSHYHQELMEHSEIIYTEMIWSSIYTTIQNLDSPFLSVSSPNWYERLEMLHNIIQFDFPGSSFAVGTLLQSDPTIIENNNTIMVLVENSHVINFTKQYGLIIDFVKTVKTQESKHKLLEILFNWLHKNDMKMYDCVLSHILYMYGTTTAFELPDFDDKFSQFSRTTPTLKEAEKVLPPLLVQNPVTVMKYLIDQALVQGSEGKVFIQILKHFSRTCLYSKDSSIPLLCDILNQYFEKRNLKVYESKNIATLYKFLAEVQAEVEIIEPRSFIRCCITPKLQLNSHNIYLILECVYELLPALLSKEFTGADGIIEHDTVASLIFSFANIIAHCIEVGNGKLKSFVAPILKKIEIHQEERKQLTDSINLSRSNAVPVIYLFTQLPDKGKEDLLMKFQDLNEMVCVYIKEFLPANVEFSSKSFIWTWCCKNEKLDFFEEKFSCETLTYPLLLNTLAVVLPHFTKDEWLYSLQLIKICCKNQVLRNEILGSFKSLICMTEAELDTYAATSCIITSLHFILNGRVCNSLYVSSCFSISLMDLVNQDKNLNSNLLMIIFLDVCYLVQCVSSDLIQIFTAVLLDLKKLIIDSCSAGSYVKDYKKLTYNAVSCITNSHEKDILLEKLGK